MQGVNSGNYRGTELALLKVERRSEIGCLSTHPLAQLTCASIRPLRALSWGPLPACKHVVAIAHTVGSLQAAACPVPQTAAGLLTANALLKTHAVPAVIVRGTPLPGPPGLSSAITEGLLVQ